MIETCYTEVKEGFEPRTVVGINNNDNNNNNIKDVDWKALGYMVTRVTLHHFCKMANPSIFIY